MSVEMQTVSRDVRFNSAPRAVALVPAFNEEFIIERTLRSLMAQTYSFEYVIVIANNCNDQTVPIVKSMQLEFGYDRLRLVVIDNNPGKKAGALNYGFDLVDPEIEYIFSMDSDTVLHPKLLEEGLKKMQREPRTGIVCSAYRTLPLSELREKPTLWEKFLWKLQNIEFGLANAWRVEHHKSARVAPGVASLYRREALQDVAKIHDGTPWVVNHNVEDYVLTLDVKDLGWDVKSYHDMISWSDVPLDLKTLRDQRSRWYSGTIDVLRQRGLRKHSRYEVFTINLLMVTLFGRIMLGSVYAFIIFSGLSVQWVTPFLAMILFSVIEQWYRLRKWGDQLDWVQKVFVLTLVDNEFYAVYREILYAYSIYLSLFRPNRKW
jgi:cellulose synthase/poly-beta-1,6-N-acetylglucosamine synthase-like glycosyltransferase